MRKPFIGRSLLLAALALVTVVASPGPAPAGVHVDLGINLPAPPPLVPVPAGPVLYAPTTPANYFFYAGQYYVFASGGWYVSAGYNGPWVVVAPEFVPRPILAVPVQYYHVRPPEWGRWRREEAPHWEARWGRGWQEHRPARVEHERGHRDGRG
jgi:hypothetical protein